MFVFGYVVLALQPLLPLNPDGKMLAPTTIFHTACSFLTNTNLQHYAGEQHLSYFSQVVVIGWYMFVSASVGFCCPGRDHPRACAAIPHMGNYYLDMWRVVAYVFFPASLVMGVLLLADGVPMTFDKAAAVTTLEPGAMGTTPDGSRSRRSSPAVRSRPFCRSSIWAPTAAASSAPTRPIPTRTPAPGPISWRA